MALQLLDQEALGDEGKDGPHSPFVTGSGKGSCEEDDERNEEEAELRARNDDGDEVGVDLVANRVASHHVDDEEEEENGKGDRHQRE